MVIDKFIDIEGHDFVVLENLRQVRVVTDRDISDVMKGIEKKVGLEFEYKGDTGEIFEVYFDNESELKKTYSSIRNALAKEKYVEIEGHTIVIVDDVRHIWKEEEKGVARKPSTYTINFSFYDEDEITVEVKCKVAQDCEYNAIVKKMCMKNSDIGTLA